MACTRSVSSSAVGFAAHAPRREHFGTRSSLEPAQLHDLLTGSRQRSAGGRKDAGFRIGHGRGKVSIGGVRFLNLDTDRVPDHVFVHAHEADVFYRAWTLTAYAICATPPDGLRVYSAAGFSDEGGGTGSTVVAPCPPGKGMLGAGFRTQPDGPDPNLVVDNVLDDFTPNGGSTTAPTSVKVTHYEEDSPTVAWLATGYAICASLFKTP
jgi:hypothetical protein